MTQRKYTLIVLLAAFVAAPAAAQESPFYIGVKVGSLSADFPGFQDANNLGVVFGSDLHKDSSGSLALEAEYTRTIGDGNISGDGGWDAHTFAAYGAYRTAGGVYVKAKAGFLDQHVDRSGPGPGQGNDSGIAFGAGVGWRLNSKAALEVGYTIMSNDLSFLSLGYSTHF